MITLAEIMGFGSFYVEYHADPSGLLTWPDALYKYNTIANNKQGVSRSPFLSLNLICLESSPVTEILYIDMW
jgi:hypothetical protein